MFSMQILRTTIFPISVLTAVGLAPGLDARQITMTPPAEVAALMVACTPIDAQGPTIREELIARGWASVPEDERRAGLAAFGAAHFWSFMPGLAPANREASFDYLVNGVEGAASSDNAAFLGFNGEFALLLWNGDSLSCIWAGPQTGAIDTLAVQLGGFPESDGTATASIDQRVEAGGRDWARRMSVGRTPVQDLPASVAGSGITDAARLDRSPL